jgi:glycosyltransferase involved in cell wall biosynthesis
MRILFVNQNPFMPQLFGGIETATFDYCRALCDIGHEAAVLASLKRGDLTWVRARMRYLFAGRRYTCGHYNGVAVYRVWDVRKDLPEIVANFSPDAVVVQANSPSAATIANEAADRGLNVAYYVHDAAVPVAGAVHELSNRVLWLANSNFTSGLIKKRVGIEAPVVPVPVCGARYVARSTREVVTMINPRPAKGGAIAVNVALRCPDIQFQFVEAWDASSPEMRELKRYASQLPNVRWRRSCADMRKIYGCTRILLVPSQVAETWGRVVTEAQMSGIPSVVSGLGALPETVGSGGVVVDPEASIDVWVNALRQLWDDESLYNQYVNAAYAHSKSANVQADMIARQLVDIIGRNFPAP